MGSVTFSPSDFHVSCLLGGYKPEYYFSTVGDKELSGELGASIIFSVAAMEEKERRRVNLACSFLFEEFRMGTKLVFHVGNKL